MLKDGYTMLLSCDREQILNKYKTDIKQIQNGPDHRTHKADVDGPAHFIFTEGIEYSPGSF